MDVSDIFSFFSARGGGRGSPRRQGGGDRLGGSRRGAGRVSAANWGNFGGGGGLSIFFSGPKRPPSIYVMYCR